MKEVYLAAADIGGTKIAASIANKKGILAKVLQLTKKQGDNKTVPRQVDYLIQSLCNKIKIKKSQISALGIATCSPFEIKNNKKVVVAPNLCGGISKGAPNNWKFIPLEQELSKIYKNIKIENDAVAGAIAERLFGKGKDENNLVYITWSTGIGTGAFVDGRLIKGKNGNAPHAGHIYLSEDGHTCGCGQKGDFESLASGTAIFKEYGKNVPVKKIFEEYRKGDQTAKLVIENAARNFAKGLVSINAVLDTKLFIIGGSVIKDKKILMPLVKKEFYKGFNPLTKDVIITTSDFGDSLGDIAALSLVMPKEWIKEWQKNKQWDYPKEKLI